MNTRRWLLALGWLSLSSCSPWTIRPIDQSENRAFDAAAYVDSIWNARALPTVAAQSVDFAQWLKSPHSDTAPAAVLVKGEGKVLRVDTASRNGLLLLDLAPYDSRPDAAIQIGPVIRGTVLRDALPFIQFSQFVNQLEFARVGNALNDRVLKAVLSPFSLAGIAGAVVTFSGASSRPSAGELPEIVPVTLARKP